MLFTLFMLAINRLALVAGAKQEGDKNEPQN